MANTVGVLMEQNMDILLASMTDHEKISVIWDILYSGDMPETKLDNIESVLLVPTRGIDKYGDYATMMENMGNT